MRVVLPTGILLILLVASIAFLRAGDSQGTPKSSIGHEQPAATTSNDSRPYAGPADIEASAANAATDSSTACSKFRIDPDHPWVAAEIARFAAFGISSRAMSAYRGLSENDLTKLAAQDDAGAMAVLGKRAFLRANGEPPEDAVAMLAGEISGSVIWSQGDPITAESEALLREADDWLYAAALHGRVFALFHVGMIRSRLYGGPVGLGWIDEETWESRDAVQKSALFAALVYNEAAFRLLGDARFSPLLELSGQTDVSKDTDEGAVATVLDAFRSDLAERNLSMPAFEPYRGPPVDDWRKEFCD